MPSAEHPKTCPFLERLPSFLQEPMEAARREEIRRHLDGCDVCRRELHELRRLIADLRPFPAAVAPGDPTLTARILDEVRRRSRPDHGGFGRLALSAAGIVAASLVILTTTGDSGVGGETPPASPAWDARASIHAGTEWLLASQEADGSWSAARHGGTVPFDIGLTGIAIQALLDSGRDDVRTRSALDRGSGWMLRHQDAGGRFGTTGAGSLYDHGPATVAVLRLADRYGVPEHVERSERAVRVLLAAQDPGGGFGYTEPARGRTNIVISFWPLIALDLARERGIAGAEEALRAGQAWVAGLCDDEGRIGYSEAGVWPSGPGTPTALGARILRLGDGRGGGGSARIPAGDLLGAWALASVDAGSARPWLAQGARRQFIGGPFHGSWPPSADAWGRDGGRVYSTSLGVLVAAAGR